MIRTDRRSFLKSACAWPLLAASATRRAAAADVPTMAPATATALPPELKPITGNAHPISAAERRARIAKLQALMEQRRIGALLIESGASLEYFTGIRWHRSERTTAAIIPARGDVLIVTPAFEEPSVRETLLVGGDVQPWDESDSPFDRDRAGAARPGCARGPYRRGADHAVLHRRRRAQGLERLRYRVG